MELGNAGKIMGRPVPPIETLHMKEDSSARQVLLEKDNIKLLN